MKINKIPRLTPIIIVSGIIISQSLFAQGPTETNADNVAQKWLNINYTGDDLSGHLLDIYLPTKGEAPYPIVITVASNSFFNSNSKQYALVLENYY